jgi:hypothetical protein
MLLAPIYPIMLGLDRLETAALLRANGTRLIVGLDSTVVTLPELTHTMGQLSAMKEEYHKLMIESLRQWKPLDER